MTYTKLISRAVIVLALLVTGNVLGQNGGGGTGIVTGQDTDRRVITTAVPFMLISPDARGSAMGDVGAATSADAFSSHWNPAKLSFINSEMGFSLSYTPWLSKIVNDMSISYLTGYKRLSKTQVVGIAIKYFDLGDIQFRDEFGAETDQFNPREFELGGTYSQVLSENLSFGANVKYVHSNIAGNIATKVANTKPANALAIDLGIYYIKDITIGGNPSKLGLATVISNIGNKVTYNSSDNKDFLPANLRLGTSLTTSLDPYNTITLAVDVNKLMVPTPPIYVNGNSGPIAKGKDPKRPYLGAIFGSFADAPDGFSEELKEFTLNIGLEYWYNKIFAVRAGYFLENADKGDRKYISMGAGFKYQRFGIDVAYLIPQTRNHPLAETLRFSLLFNMGESGEDAVTEE